MRTMIGAVIGLLAPGVMTSCNSNGGRAAGAADMIRDNNRGGYENVPQQLVASHPDGWREGAFTAGTAAGQIIVKCEPSQRAIVRRSTLEGQDVSEVLCVGDAFGYADQSGRPVQGISDGLGRARDWPADTRLVQASEVYRAPEEGRRFQRATYQAKTR